MHACKNCILFSYSLTSRLISTEYIQYGEIYKIIMCHIYIYIYIKIIMCHIYIYISKYHQWRYLVAVNIEAKTLAIYIYIYIYIYIFYRHLNSSVFLRAHIISQSGKKLIGGGWSICECQ